MARLVERLQKLAKWHEEITWGEDECRQVVYHIEHEDARALLMEAAEHIKGLQLLIDEPKQRRANA